MFVTMKIETKYNVGDKVWVIDDTQKAVNVRVQHIDVEFHSATPFEDDMLSITYEFGFGKRREEFVFPTKEELLASL